MDLRRPLPLLTLALAASLAAAAPAPDFSHARFRAVPFSSVAIHDAFWSPRIERAATATLDQNLKMCEQTGRISNFLKAAGRMEGKFEGIYFNDSDVFKMIEGAAYALALRPDPAMEGRVDAVIDAIAAAQQPDGYLNSYFTLVEPDKRFTDLAAKHELYCAGHLLEAGVAYAELRGKRKLLEVACRLADHIDRIFGPGKRIGFCGHQEIELALFKLWQATGERRYYDLARFFIDARGATPSEEYMQAHKPLREQSVVVGHAVRATYFFSAAADLAMTTGEKELIGALDRLWENLVLKRMYVTGGIGPSASNEGFTRDYDLPNRTAYAETCAGIGLLLWNYRMALLHGNAVYADVVERSLYNGILSGVSLDGRRFFYVNPLQAGKSYSRSEWFGCACCPPNILRVIPQVGRFAYAVSGEEGVAVNLFLGSTLSIDLGGKPLKLVQETEYPWSGTVNLTVAQPGPGAFTLWIRRPGWVAGEVAVTINGNAVAAPAVDRGYLAISRTWKAGDRVTMDFPMEIQRIVAHPKVEADAGRIALQRGPIVYCLESADNSFDFAWFSIPPGAEIKAVPRPDLLGGAVVLEGTAEIPAAVSWRGKLYQSLPKARRVPFVAIPYSLWCNRGPADMVVWVPASSAVLPRTVAARARVSASHRHDDIGAVSDGQLPSSSNDRSVPRFTFWDHRGTTEWIEYAFPERAGASAVSVYWFDDETTGGGCRVPASWKLFRRDGDAWKPIETKDAFGTNRDAANRVSFEPVETNGLRIEVKLKDGFSAGILEWDVEE